MITRRASRKILLFYSRKRRYFSKKKKAPETACPFEAVNCSGVFVNTTEFYHRRYSCFLATNKFPLAVLVCHHKANLVFCVQPLLTALGGSRERNLSSSVARHRGRCCLQQTRLDCRVLDVTEALSSTVYIEFDKLVSTFSPKIQTSNNSRRLCSKGIFL